MKKPILGLALAALLAAPTSSDAQLFRRRPRAFVAAPARRVVVARPRVVVAPARRFAVVAPARRFGFVQPRRFVRGF